MKMNFRSLLTRSLLGQTIYEPPHDNTNKVACVPSEDSDQSGHLPFHMLSTWRKLGSLATHWAYSEDSDQTGLIWVFDGRTVILLVLSWGGSVDKVFTKSVKKWCRQRVTLGLGKSPAEMMKFIDSSETMNPCSVSVVYKWHERFRNGRKSTEDEFEGWSALGCEND